MLTSVPNAVMTYDIAAIAVIVNNIAIVIVAVNRVAEIIVIGMTRYTSGTVVAINTT